MDAVNKAHWIMKNGDWFCSACGAKYDEVHDDCCCECGANMSEEADYEDN